MLGEQYAEVRGKITGQRVLDVEGPTIETSVSVSGTMKGIPVQEMLTFIGIPTTKRRVIHGVGKGVVIALGDAVEGEPEMVTYTGEGIGRLSAGGSIKWRGSIFYRKQYYSRISSEGGGKLAFLNNMVGLFETKIVYPMHGSCIEDSIFSKYADAIIKNDFAYSGMLLGQKLEAIS
jgi:hypothetical protein